MQAYFEALKILLQPANFLVMYACALVGCVLGAIPGLSGGLLVQSTLSFIAFGYSTSEILYAAERIVSTAFSRRILSCAPAVLML